MNNGYKLISPEKSHAGEISQIEIECFSVPWSYEVVSNVLSSKEYVFAVAADAEGNIVGYGSYNAVLDEGNINNIAVRANCRRKGIADAILGELMNKAKAGGIASLYLEVRKNNLAAAALYEKHGFEQIAVRKRYYTEPRDDAVIMKCEIL